MKIYFSRILVAGGMLLTFSSCREELVTENQVQDQIIAEGTTRNGRLYFPNRESLQKTYENLKDAEDELIANYVDSKNITSLRPILTKANEEQIGAKIQARRESLRLNKRFMASRGSSAKLDNPELFADDIDDLEEIIGDDAYGAFLDSRAEIQVGKEIYKYTDVGLFIVQEQKYDELGQYLAVKYISDDLLYPTEASVKQEFIESMPSEKIVAATENINYYNARILPNDPDSGGYGGGPGPSNPPVTDPNVQMSNFINSLQNCAPTNGLFDGVFNLFGNSDICKDQYESRYRVKTKAYNYDYLLVYNLGVKVKHQYKGWTGIWRQENADAIRIGVIGSSFLYDYSNIMNVGPPSGRSTTIYSNNSKAVFNAGTFWTQSAYYPGIYNMTGYSIQGYPKLFKDDYYIEDILNRFDLTSPNPLLDEGLYAALKAGNANLSAAALNKLLWTSVIKKLGAFEESINKPKPDNNITYSYNLPQHGKIAITKTFYNQKNNDSKLEKSFDWGFQIGFTMDPNGGSVKPDLSGGGLKKPKDFKVLMYGIAKRNGQWHGSKMNTGI
jgi:hypothetical protein